MLLFLLIPLALVACTIAITPVLAMTVVEHRPIARAPMGDVRRIAGDRGVLQPADRPDDSASRRALAEAA